MLAASPYVAMAQKVRNLTVLQIVLSIGGAEIMHFQTWQDKAGNATPLTDTDPINGSTVTFVDLQTGQPENLQANLIMPEPCQFIDPSLPPCSIIRPTGAGQVSAHSAHRVLAAVGLPCRGGNKADCRVGSEIRCHLSGHHPRKEPRQPRLPAQQKIEDNDVDDAENSESQRVKLPIHLALRTEADEPVDQSLDWQEQRIEKGVSPLEHTFQICADRLDQQGKDKKECPHLKGTGRAHIISAYGRPCRRDNLGINQPTDDRIGDRDPVKMGFWLLSFGQIRTRKLRNSCANCSNLDTAFLRRKVSVSDILETTYMDFQVRCGDRTHIGENRFAQKGTL
jgi:hypothetical protein